MRLSEYAERLLQLAETVHRWLGALGELDRGRREQVAKYASSIADTLARAADAIARMETDPAGKAAETQAIRELGRLAGYFETIVGVLEHHLDGRKLAGVKRRLELLKAHELEAVVVARSSRLKVGRLVSAEGYFRALADGLRT